MSDSSAAASAGASPRDNALLGSLPAAEFAQLAEHVEMLALDWQDLLYEVNGPIEYVYFPVDALASLLMRADKDTMVEIGAIGREGMLGVPLFLGSSTSPHTAYCQVAGQAARVPAKALQEVLHHAPTLHERLNLFSNTLMTQFGQNAVCNRAHNTEQRCARWLLLTADRVDRDEFDITHEFLAHMLGVRRATVSETARSLAEANLIRYRRGRLTILDRPGLTERACPCYEQARAQLKQLLE